MSFHSESLQHPEWLPHTHLPPSPALARAAPCSELISKFFLPVSKCPGCQCARPALLRASSWLCQPCTEGSFGGMAPLQPQKTREILGQCPSNSRMAPRT